MKKQEQGMVLFMCLVILFVLTITVLSTSKGALIQSKMTAAVRDSSTSLNVSEAGLYDAGDYIQSLLNTGGFSSTGVGGLYTLGNGPLDVFAPAVWAVTNTRQAVTSIDSLTALYFIEDMGQMNVDDVDPTNIAQENLGQTAASGSMNVFKVVSRSTGPDGLSERITTAYYGKSF